MTSGDRARSNLTFSLQLLLSDIQVMAGMAFIGLVIVDGIFPDNKPF